ncbi:MAG: class I SAM-dependent rRNA methyltransferase [Deltaproteobacteria bacterium]|nr:class I SAM-dependent rRNA methyltransferase [Deltaproteobacteria bacterium]
MGTGSVIITSRSAKKITEGYPWVFERDLLSRRYPEAGIVAVHDKRGAFVGQAFYSPTSKIVLRFITRSKAKIEKQFLATTLKNAHEKRKGLTKITNAYRVVNAEGDGLPSVIIDRYNDVFALQITSAGAEKIKEDIVSCIIAAFKPRAIVEKNKTETRKLEGLPLTEGLLHGADAATRIFEGTQQFDVDVLHGQKTGAYLDYRAFRLKAAALCSGTALDLCCYDGWFACQIAHKAIAVTAVDASESALKRAAHNAEINGHKNITCINSDLFEFLKTDAALYDFIHVDPPPFARGRAHLDAAIKAYEKIIATALKKLRPGGTLLTSSCSHHISERILEGIVHTSAEGTGIRYNIVFRGIQDHDHPVLKKFPESLYLKAVAIKIF